MPVMPPLIVEVLSPSNNRAQVAYKVSAYLATGAKEVANVGVAGAIEFHRADGAHEESVMGVKLALPPAWFSR